MSKKQEVCRNLWLVKDEDITTYNMILEVVHSKFEYVTPTWYRKYILFPPFGPLLDPPNRGCTSFVLSSRIISAKFGSIWSRSFAIEA
jgi:hypothetical protein